MQVLLATDGSEHAEAAAALLARLPLPQDCRITVLTALEAEGFETAAAEAVARCSERLRPGGWPIDSLVRPGNPADQIIEAAVGADLVVLGARGHGRFRGLLLGGVPAQVVTYAPCSVLVARPTRGEASVPVRSVLGFDGSESAWTAVRHIAALPPGDRLAVTLVGAMIASVRFYGMDLAERASELYEADRESLRAQLEAAAELLRAGAKHVGTELREGADVCEELLAAAAEREAELVIVGDRGDGGLARRFVGSLGSKLVRHAAGSVWVARPRR